MLYDWFTILLEPRIPSEIHLSSWFSMVTTAIRETWS
jgi:hypothetical protein